VAGREDAARRIGFPTCKKCRRVAALEQIHVFDEPGSPFYISFWLCVSCASEYRADQKLFDEAARGQLPDWPLQS